MSRARRQRFRKDLRPHENIKPAFSNLSTLAGVFEKLRIPYKVKRDGVNNTRNNYRPFSITKIPCTSCKLE